MCLRRHGRVKQSRVLTLVTVRDFDSRSLVLNLTLQQNHLRSGYRTEMVGDQPQKF